MNTDRQRSRELVRQLRAKALKVKAERSEGEKLRGAITRVEGRTISRSASNLTVQQRSSTPAR
jgi:hypothetical protein